MKKKYLVLGLAIAVVLVGTIGIAAAIRSDKEQTITANISEKDLGVTVLNSSNPTGSVQTSVSPNGSVPLHYCVKNTGGSATDAEGSYDIYAKVDVYYDFTAADGSAINWSDNYDEDLLSFYANVNSVSLADVDLQNYATNDFKIAYGANYGENGKQFQVIGNWILVYSDQTQLTFIYNQPLAYGQVTSEFLSYMDFSEDMDNTFAGASLSLDYEITAVQASSGTDAIAAEWGLYPTIDENGMITDVSETK